MPIRPTEKVEADIVELVKQFARGPAGDEGRAAEEKKDPLNNDDPRIAEAVKGCEVPRDEQEAKLIRGSRNRITVKQLRLLRALARAKEQGKDLVHLDPKEAAPWIRPFWESARLHSLALQDEMPGDSAVTKPLAYELATARALYRAFLSLGAKNNNVRALREARSWLKASLKCLETFALMQGRGKVSESELGWLDITPEKKGDKVAEHLESSDDPYLPEGIAGTDDVHIPQFHAHDVEVPEGMETIDDVDVSDDGEVERDDLEEGE